MKPDFRLINHLNLTSEQQKAVGFLAEFTKQMVVLAFEGEKTLVKASNLISEIYRFTDEIMRGSLRKGAKPSCKKRCYWCCFLMVKATPLEVACVADDLHNRLDPGELSVLIRKMEDFIGKIRVSGNGQELCPLNIQGDCMVYPVRPIACRTYHSLNVMECKTSMGKDGGSVTVRRDISGLSIGINAGLAEGLRMVGLQSRQLDLVSGLRILMVEPNSVVMNRWLTGEPAFAAAEIANAKKIEVYYHNLVVELGELL